MEVPIQSTVGSPADRLCTEPSGEDATFQRRDARDQRGGIGLVLPEGVVLLVLQPVALAAARDVHAHHAAVALQRTGQPIEVAAVAREAVHAHHHMRVGGPAPVGVGDAVKAVRSEAREAPGGHSHAFTASSPLAVRGPVRDTCCNGFESGGKTDQYRRAGAVRQ